MFTLAEIEKAVCGRLIGRKRNNPVLGISIDSRTLRRGDLFFAIRGKIHDGHEFMPEARKRGASAYIVDCDAFRRQIADGFENVIVVENTTEALGRLAEFHRSRLAMPACAITGSCGKTTTKEMAALLLGKLYRVHATPGNLNNQYGLPLTLFQVSKTHHLILAELGASRPGDIANLAAWLRPRWGVITNVRPAHLEGLGSLDAVYRVKLELAQALEKEHRTLDLGEFRGHVPVRVPRDTNGYVSPEQATLIIPGADERLVREARKFAVKIVTFGIEKGFDYAVTEVKALRGEIEFQVNGRVKFRIADHGLFNVDNAAAAIALASECGVPLEAMPKALRRFRPLGGRFEKIWLEGRILLVHDAYNANPASMKEGLKAFQALEGLSRRILVLGDMLELGNEAEHFHRELGREAASMGVSCLITLGKNAVKIAEEAKAASQDREDFEVRHCASHAEVTTLLLERLKPGDGVFLKASHSMNFQKIIDFLRFHPALSAKECGAT